MASWLEELPLELLISISSYLEKSDNRALRLSSKALSNAATRNLFTEVHVHRSGAESYKGWSNILAQPQLAKHVRSVVYNTVRDGVVWIRPIPPPLSLA